MRRCELAGAHRDVLDLDAGTLAIEVTRVVVDGRVIESAGKTENAQHVLALDPFTMAVLRAHVERLDQERRDFGPDYSDHGVLFCWPDGRPPHPDGRDPRRVSLANPLASDMQKAPSLFEKGPLALVAGAGFEPATSGL